MTTITTFPYTDVSIDIETLGNKYNAPLLSIGAASFNRHTGKHGPTFYQEIDPVSSLRVGTPTASTIAWWIKQGKDAQRIFDESEEARANKMHLASALLNFTTFVRSLGAPCVWGNGPSFDITIIEHSIDKGSVGLEPPWVFWNVRDVRTAVDFAEGITSWKRGDVQRKGVHHNALDDAIHQADLVIAAYRALGGKTVAAPYAKPVKATAASVKKVTPIVEDDDDL